MSMFHCWKLWKNSWAYSKITHSHSIQKQSPLILGCIKQNLQTGPPVCSLSVFTFYWSIVDLWCCIIQSDSVIHILIPILFHTLFPYGLWQSRVPHAIANVFCLANSWYRSFWKDFCRWPDWLIDSCSTFFLLHKWNCMFAFNHTERYPYGNVPKTQSEIQDSSKLLGPEKSQIKGSAYL